MKKIDKKELPKLIALVVLSAGVFGYAAMQFMAPPKTSAGTPAKSANGAASDAGQPQAGQEDAEGAGGDASEFHVQDLAIVTTGKDPFVPNGPAAPRDPNAPPPPAAPAPAPPVQVAVAAPAPGPMPALPVTGMGGPPPFPALGMQVQEVPRPQPGAAVRPVVLPPPPPPSYTVTGVVRDETPDACSGKVAILRGGEGNAERRFVKCGDSVGNGFTVIAVRQDGVEIESGSRRVTLKLGASR
jgi:hypothetical protein